MKGEKNHIDEWLKNQIKKGIKIIYHTLEGRHPNTNVLYYTGHLQKDILDNFPGRTNKKIFKGYREFLNNSKLIFTQKKFPCFSMMKCLKIHILNNANNQP